MNAESKVWHFLKVSSLEMRTLTPGNKVPAGPFLTLAQDRRTCWSWGQNCKEVSCISSSPPVLVLPQTSLLLSLLLKADITSFTCYISVFLSVLTLIPTVLHVEPLDHQTGPQHELTPAGSVVAGQISQIATIL